MPNSCEKFFDYWIKYWKAVWNIEYVPIKDDAEKQIRNYLVEIEKKIEILKVGKIKEDKYSEFFDRRKK